MTPRLAPERIKHQSYSFSSGRISPDEYREFQAFKQKHKDWQEQLKVKLQIR